jgi:hypothetical protein
MSIKQAKLLIGIAMEIDDKADRDSLLELAIKELNNYSDIIKADNKDSIEFPIRVFRKYKGQLFEGNLVDKWHIILNKDGYVFDSPSAAAMFISGHNENGWRVWRHLDKSTNTEQPIDKLRRIN